MNSEPLTLIKDVAIIALMVSGFALCLTLTIGLVRIFPSLRRSLFNLEKASEAAPEVAANAVTASQAIAAAAENVKTTTAKG